MERKWLNSVSVTVGDDGLLNSGPLATEAKQDNLLAVSYTHLRAHET